ncbi:Metallopeptidase, catalytic domain [Fusarium austroafricanum]|uniref:Metallopeptidase, catalytic domain n=1 Tax=Fusarium austroafricanum TaxID=2364996 RepID=A0A8H4K9B4_9HYPO|nr:Metallopeptidase, catalytic domain [Fusarium austroafricanum]
MIPPFLLLLCWGLFALGSPTPQSSKFSDSLSLEERDPPVIGKGISKQHKKQLRDAARDTLQLATFALMPSPLADEIFAKWFDPRDRNIVNKVFKAMVGDQYEDDDGNPILGSITIVSDYKNEDDEWACTDDTMAEIRDYDTKNPKIVVCPKTGFGSGGLGKGYKGVEALRCSSFDDQVSTKMDSLGSVLLHEYTHWDLLVKGIFKNGTDDVGYGPYKCQHLPRKDKLKNADNYSWFANEVYWSSMCGVDYGKPSKDDE